MNLSNPQVSITVTKPWSGHDTLYITGPGGVGKSTLGKRLSPLLKLPAIDLDDEFCSRIGNIGDYIRTHGYESYREQNNLLARKLSSKGAMATIWIMSSGFLAGPVPDDIYRDNRTLVESGYVISLMPATDIDEATRIVVDRQMNRGFNLDRHREERKFRERYEQHRNFGDMLVTSAASPSSIADAVHSALVFHR